MGKRRSSYEDQNYTKQPFLLSVDELLEHLQSRKGAGLSASQVQQYQAKYGENKLAGEGRVQWYTLLLKQLSHTMILVLILGYQLWYDRFH